MYSLTESACPLDSEFRDLLRHRLAKIVAETIIGTVDLYSLLGFILCSIMYLSDRQSTSGDDRYLFVQH